MLNHICTSTRRLFAFVISLMTVTFILFGCALHSVVRHPDGTVVETDVTIDNGILGDTFIATNASGLITTNVSR